MFETSNLHYLESSQSDPIFADELHIVFCDLTSDAPVNMIISRLYDTKPDPRTALVHFGVHFVPLGFGTQSQTQLRISVIMDLWIHLLWKRPEGIKY